MKSIIDEQKLTILVTGARGFLGKNLVAFLKQSIPESTILEHDLTNSEDELLGNLRQANFIYHLAGVNRPKDSAEFCQVNLGLTEFLTEKLRSLHKKTPIAFSSSIQAKLDNPYGISKRNAEEALIAYSQLTGAHVYLFRFPNIFGKWSRPNYNSVVATFCHNISRDEEIVVDDPKKQLELIYVDDVVKSFGDLVLESSQKNEYYCKLDKTSVISLGELEKTLKQFRKSRQNLELPDFSSELTRQLYATYISFLDENDFSYSLQKREDSRGWLVEFFKSQHFGQIFVSTTKPGITRGNHFHNTKVEKFCVIKGDGVIRFRNNDDSKIIEYRVSDKDIAIVDIPPGYTHSIENVSMDEMIVLFWADEGFSSEHPDTYYLKVKE